MKIMKFTNTSMVAKEVVGYGIPNTYVVPAAKQVMVDDELTLVPGVLNIPVMDCVVVSPEDSLSHYQNIFANTDIVVDILPDEPAVAAKRGRKKSTTTVTETTTTTENIPQQPVDQEDNTPSVETNEK